MKIKVTKLKKAGPEQLWIMRLDLRDAPSCLKFPKVDWWDDFDKVMDEAFIYPFNLRRYGGWRRLSESHHKKIYWCCVIFP